MYCAVWVWCIGSGFPFSLCTYMYVLYTCNFTYMYIYVILKCQLKTQYIECETNVNVSVKRHALVYGTSQIQTHSVGAYVHIH